MLRLQRRLLLFLASDLEVNWQDATALQKAVMQADIDAEAGKGEQMP